jgi:hypothetical protein
MYLPRTRGCTAAPGATGVGAKVSPAHARMHRRLPCRHRPRRRISRARADAPLYAGGCDRVPQYLPRTRGCTSRSAKRVAYPAVSPAHARMHRRAWADAHSCSGISRARADAPVLLETVGTIGLYLPRTRGCTPAAERRSLARRVSPAHARMHPVIVSGQDCRSGISRARADAPHDCIVIDFGTSYLPRTRGCTVDRLGDADGRCVSPAHARMHRSATRSPCGSRSISRARADAPLQTVSPQLAEQYLPRTRGCTGRGVFQYAHRRVSPAHARMHLSRRADPSSGPRISRARADAPNTKSSAPSGTQYLPRTRGCTGHHVGGEHGAGVSPARARMHRWSSTTPGRPISISRARADAPVTAWPDPVAIVCLPRTRGCTVGGVRGGHQAVVSPAHARMHRSAGKAPRSSRRISRARADAPMQNIDGAYGVVYLPRPLGCTNVPPDEPALHPVSSAQARMHPSSGKSMSCRSGICRARMDATCIFPMIGPHLVPAIFFDPHSWPNLRIAP